MVAKKTVLGAVLALTVAVVWILAAEEPTPQQLRAKAAALFQAGNYKDAHDSLRKLALDSANDPLRVGKDLELGLTSLQKLGRIDEADDFIEAVAAVHAKNWRLLEAAAQGYENTPHFG